MKHTPKPIYAISRGYRQLTMWHCDQNQRRISISVRIPFPHIPRYEKYREIKESLRRFDIPVPDYVPTRKETESAK